MRRGVRRAGYWFCAAAVFSAALASGAWAIDSRSQSQSACMLEVWKAKRELWLKQNGHIVRRFRVSLGGQPATAKLHQGDGRTPVGTYYVSEKRPNSAFHRFLGISYPNVDDAERGFADHLISADQWADILFANLRKQPPPWHTPLGGRVGIHGHGGRHAGDIDWTEGCIAVSDDDIDYLYDVVSVGTPVQIHD